MAEGQIKQKEGVWRVKEREASRVMSGFPDAHRGGDHGGKAGSGRCSQCVQSSVRTWRRKRLWRRKRP